MSNIDDSLKVLSDNEIKLYLVLQLSNSFYYLIRDKNDNKIGECGIRLNNKESNKYYGNIEYEIYPEYRGNNYAEKASKLLSQVALYYNVTKITIIASPDNLSSIKTIEKLGAKFIEVRKVPRNMRLYKIKKVKVYEWNLEKGEIK